MLVVDESRWPLALVRWEGPVCGCDLEFYRWRFESWLARETAFALVSVSLTPVPMPNCLRHEMGHWLHARRALIGQRCAGMASVPPADLYCPAWARSYSSAIGAQLGCFAAAFPEEPPAIEWALEQLRADAPRARGGEHALSLASLH